MPASKTRVRKRGALTTRRRRSRMAIAVTVLLSLMTALTMLGYSGAHDSPFRQNPKSGHAVSTSSLNSNSPSKEYVYAGGRLVATEEPQSCIPVLTATSPQSYPATPSPNTGAISVSIGSTCAWTATSNATWLTFPFGSSGTGGGSLTYSVAQNTLASIRSGSITVSGTGGSASFSVYQGVEFADVPTTHPFYSFIGRLAARGVTVGCGTNPPVFCPDQTVPHDQMAVFVLRAKGEPTPPTPPSQRFADVPSTYWAYAFIDRMDALNIWNGCGFDQFGHRIYCPASIVSREQMAAIIIRGIGEYNPPTPPSQRFYDVPPSNPYYNFIDRMAALGITLGCGTGCNTIGMSCYCPASSVTRGQMAVFLVRAFNL